MNTFKIVENISDLEFINLQKNGWILVCVDSIYPQKLVYRFVRTW